MNTSNLDCDILVIGAGAAGIAAAVAASTGGSRVCIIERNAYPGGKATAAEVGTICGLYRFSKTTDASFICSGYPKEFAEKLQQRSQTSPMHNSEGLHFLPYDINAFKELCLDELNRSNINCLFNSSLYSVEHDAQTVHAILVKTENKFIRIQLKTIVDCSGESVLSQIAGFPLIKNQQYQAAAQVFTLENIQETDESRLSLILIKSVRSAIRDKILSQSFERINIVQGSLKNNRVTIKLGIPLAVTYEEGNLEALKNLANSMVHHISDFLCNTVPAFTAARLEHIAPEVGTRVGFRTEGIYSLTDQDVLQCKKFPDGIANGSWPVEEWIEQKRVSMQYFSLDDYYQIPSGCIRSASIQNLFMAGRTLAATQTAIASARVIGTCLQTGYAAGVLAADYILQIPISESIHKIRNSQL